MRQVARPVHPFLLGMLRDDPRALDPGGDWPAVIAEARVHALVPLLYAWLRRSEARGQRAGDWLGEIRGECFRVAARNAAQAVALKALLVAFRDAGLPCVPLRGLALTERLYGERAARPMGDIDLLVRRADLEPVRNLLVASGYRELDRRRGFAEAYSYTLEFYRDRWPDVVVEPHWTIAYPPAAGRLDMDRVWARCLPATVLGVESRSLCAEDLLLHLGLHLIHSDTAVPLLWLYEMDRFVRQAAAMFDWTAVVQVARDAGVGEPMRRVLGEARELLDTPIPDGVLDRLGVRPAAPRLAQRVAQTSVDGRESLALFFDLEGVGPKLRYALAILFPAPDFMRIHYGLSGGVGLGLAYLRRFCRLTLEAGRAAVLLARRRTHPAGSHR